MGGQTNGIRSLQDSWQLFGQEGPLMLLGIVMIVVSLILFVLWYRLVRHGWHYEERRSQAFARRAHKAMGRECDFQAKSEYVRRRQNDYREVTYYLVTYEYFVDGTRYTYRRRYEMFHDDHPQEHEFWYDPARPEQAYWSPQEYRKQKRWGCLGCLGTVVVWLVAMMLILGVATLLGIELPK